MTDVVTGLTGWRQGRQLVAFQNFAADAAASVDASSEVAGREAVLSISWAAGDQKWNAASAGDGWLRVDLGSARSADCFGIYGHNFGTAGAEISFQYASAAGGPWSDLVDPESPTTDGTIFRVADEPVSARYWRVFIDNPSVAPIVAIFFVGKSLRLYSGPPIPFAPPPFWTDDEILNSETEGGEFMGRSVLRRANRCSVGIDLAPVSWAREYYLPFRDHVRTAPFFYAWNYDDRPNESALCYSDGAIPRISLETNSIVSHRFDVVALL